MASKKNPDKTPETKPETKPEAAPAPAADTSGTSGTPGASDTIDSDMKALNGDPNAPAVGLLAQYVKDLSFENPSAPMVQQWQGAPKTDVQFNIGVQKIDEQTYEVLLKIDITTKAEQGTMFVVDLSYAGLFGVRNVPEEELQPFFFAEAPRILFPFARRIIADVVRDGNFAPLLLEPIDFHGLFAQQLAQREQESRDQAAESPIVQS